MNSNTFLAYKFVAVGLMIASANEIGSQLDLRMRFPIKMAELQRTQVFPPDMPNGENLEMYNYGGRINTKDYGFSFSDAGRLCYITRLHPWGKMTVAQQNDMLVKQNSTIDEHEAYSIATNWLAITGVDLKRLEEKYRVEVFHQFQWSPTNKNQKEYLPLFNLSWGKKDPKVIVEIDGRTRDLLPLRLEDDSVSTNHGWGFWLTNRSVLTNISDATYLAWSPEQREQLLGAFIANGKHLADSVSNSAIRPLPIH